MEIAREDPERDAGVDTGAGPPPAVVLVRPREDGNVGAACRAMANMGLGELVLVEPVVKIGVLGRALAKGADHVLEGARRARSLAEAVEPYQRVVGTAALRARSASGVLAPRELPAVLAADPPGSRAALVFGPEVGGLTNDELALCHPLVNVPCDPVQPTLNLAQAVLILAYELFVARLARGDAAAAVEPEPPAEPAEHAQVEALFAQGVDLLRRVDFARDDTFEHVRRDLRRLLARAALSAREAIILRGVCRRLDYALDRAEEPAEGRPDRLHE